MLQDEYEVPAPSALDHLERSVRRLEQRTHELEQSLVMDFSTVMEDAVRFSLTNLRSQLSQLEQRTGHTGERLQMLALEYADLQRIPDPDPQGIELYEAPPPVPQPLIEQLRLDAQTLAHQVAEQQARLQAAEAEAASLRPLTAKVHDQAARIADLEDRLARQERERVAACEAAARVAGLEATAADLERRLHAALQEQTRLRQAATGYEQQLRAQAERETALRSERDRVQASFDAAQSALAARQAADDENTALRAQVGWLRQAGAELEVQNQTLRVQLRESRRTLVDAARMVSAVSELRGRLQELTRKHSDTLEESGRLRRENLEVRAELKELLVTLEGLNPPQGPEGPSTPSRADVLAAEQTIAEHVRSELSPPGA